MNPILPQLRAYKHEARTIQLCDAIGMEANAFNRMANRIQSRGVSRVVGESRYALAELNSRLGLLGAIATCIEAWYSEHGCLDPGDFVQWEADVLAGRGRSLLPPPPRGEITR